MAWKSLDEMALAGKRVLTRVDINVPVEDGRVTDATRITRIVPTVRAILDAGGMPILLAHFGRPKGKRVPEMSLQPLVPALEEAFGAQVVFAADCIGAGAQAAADALQAGQVLLLENTRFHAEEEANDADFAAQMAALGDIYCNDAFSAAHRAHASTEALARLLPSCAGHGMAAELRALEAALGNPERPVLAVVGGAKVSTKLDLLGNLVAKVDILVIGGGMANTFLAAQGIDVGKSLCEHELAETARTIAQKAADAGCEILLPSDVVLAREFKARADHLTLPVREIPEDMMILDVGPATRATLSEAVARSKTLIMNGPLGVFEMAPFHAGTFALLDDIARATNAGNLISVAGGGDTVAAINAAEHGADFTYISTAGGAFLEWMEGKTLPGVAALG